MVNLRKRRPKTEPGGFERGEKRKVCKAARNASKKILDPGLLLNETVAGDQWSPSRGITSAEIFQYSPDGDAHWELAPKLALPR